MKNNDIYIIGIGHNTPVIMELAMDCGYVVKGLYHYNQSLTGKIIHNVPVLGSTNELFDNDISGKQFAISVGNNNIRSNIAKNLSHKKAIMPTLIHPSAWVSKFANIENSVLILPHATIQANVKILSNSIISINTTIVHNSFIGESCYVAGNAIVGAYVKINDRVLIGMNSTIVSGKVDYIGENVIIGAGAVVINNVEKNKITIGNPARVKS